MKKKISYNDYLKALGLYTLCQNCYKEGQKFENALAKLLNYNETYMGFISDGVFEGTEFEDCLIKEGFEIEQGAMEESL